ncbi:MAG: hypothetical protein K940chlam2_00946 [Chlamydiae bacterium]|nr:hypothetical protein [Chlamydiota bacterium]
MKCAIFSCMGLGDGLIIQTLAHNLQKGGHAVTIYHPFLEALQEWFPGRPFQKFPTSLPECDRHFIIYERSDHMKALMEEAIQKYPEKTTILNAIATPRSDYPYWEQGRFDGREPFAVNLAHFCRDILKIEGAGHGNGIAVPAGVERGKYLKRVVIHPTSSRAGKNWSKKKFIQLAQQLRKAEYDPVFILTSQEKEDWPEVNAPQFASLDAVARFVAESGAMVGNDSGIGHLASCLGVPTLTICRNQMAADFWRPAWAPGSVIVPPKWIPNLKGMRWRDQKWQAFVPVSRVLRAFLAFG